VLVILLPTVDRDLQIKLFRAATGMIGADRPGARGAAGVDNLILGRPSASLVQDHLNFGWVTTIRAEAELAEGIAPPLQ
jgi:hypothetical protein